MISKPPPAISHYSIFTDDSGYPIHSLFVDFRDPEIRTPITPLIKYCEKQYAFENCGTICISKPAKYRHFGETLVNDPAEAKHTHTTLTRETVDDPDELAAANAPNEELNRMTNLTKVKFQRTITSITTKHEESRYLTFEKNGWIYCASIKPREPKEKELLENSFHGNNYNHTTFIYRPFEFALALGSMVVEQLGPQLNNAETRISVPGQKETLIKTKGQKIIHGPVVYVDDPYEVVSDTIKEFRDIFFPLFVKNAEFQNQQEYRYVVLADQEPVDENKILHVSPAMAGTTRTHPNPLRPPPMTQNTPLLPPNETANPLTASSHFIQHEPQSTNFSPDADDFPSLGEAFTDPTTPILVSEDNTVTNALRALRTRVNPIFGNATPLPEVAAAAYHAEPCMLDLYQTFEKPVEKISIEDNNLIVLHINFPPESNANAKLIFGPLGISMLEIQSPHKKTVTRNHNRWTTETKTIMEELSEAGLPALTPKITA